MNLYLLDTHSCILLLNQRVGFEGIARHMDGLERRQIAISAMTMAQLEFGIAASKRQGDNSSRLERLLLEFEVMPFDRESARPYGRLRASLQAQGTPIGPMDFLIAAHALAANAVLVTNNTREFQRIPGLALEDWS